MEPGWIGMPAAARAGGALVVGTLYLQKAAHAKLGSPKRITVTIEAKG